MKAVIQRVMNSDVQIDGETVGKIGKGLMVLLGVMDGDTKSDADKLVKKIPNLRIFEDENGKMNLSCLDAGGEILVVSNFTLYADCKKGKRPSFTDAARPETAVPLYELFVKNLECKKTVKTGIFGADMKILAENDGPVTVVIDSGDLKNGR